MLRARQTEKQIKRVNADRLGARLFGFFFGSTLTGAGIYYYVLDEYKLSNELLTEDIYVSAIRQAQDAGQMLRQILIG